MNVSLSTSLYSQVSGAEPRPGAQTGRIFFLVHAAGHGQPQIHRAPKLRPPVT
ncbi:MAG TPA: hypothetical protein VHZ09_18005 [Acidobacteriaceae bacterium]|nr:hypothetical protein [Acidobacteriaceae bacterium]